MAVREVIRIDEERCDGCGQCVPACAEGAIAVIDGKARLVSEVYCDGMGACLGHCPQGAITIERTEALPFDEAAVAERQARGTRREARVALPTQAGHAATGHHEHNHACPGSRMLQLAGPPAVVGGDPAGPQPSMLRQWPVQLHLVSPGAPYFRGADVLLAADCVAFAVGDFHRAHLAGRALAIACPKLDGRQELYVDKLAALIDQAGIASLTVMIMEVPCCGGLLQHAVAAAARATRQVRLRYVVVGVHGDVLESGEVGAARPARAATLPTLA